VERDEAERRAWELLVGLYEDEPKFGCPDQERLLPFLPAATEHFLSGGEEPWPLLHPQDVTSWEEATDEFERIIQPLNFPERRDPKRTKCWLWIMDKFKACEEERPFGTATRGEAHAIAMSAARQLYEHLGVRFPPRELDPPPGMPYGLALPLEETPRLAKNRTRSS